jgi:hypothetical protein
MSVTLCLGWRVYSKALLSMGLHLSAYAAEAAPAVYGG